MEIDRDVKPEPKEYKELSDFLSSYQYIPSPEYRDNLTDKIYFYLDQGKRKGKSLAEKLDTEKLNPSLLHKFAKKTKEEKKILNGYIANEMISKFDNFVGDIYFLYGCAQKEKMSHWESMKFVKKNPNLSVLEDYRDIEEAFAISNKMKKGNLIIKRWSREWTDENEVKEFIKNEYKNESGIGKMKSYEKVIEKISIKFGRTMSLSTFYSYIKDSKAKAEENEVMMKIAV